MREGAVSKHATRFVMYAFLIIASFISVFPLFWAFVSATNASNEVLAGRMLPGPHLIENMKALFAYQNVPRAMMNSFGTSFLQVIMTLIVCSIAGYGFEIYHDKYKDAVMALLMLAMMVPFVAILVPLFQMFSSMKLLDSWVGFFLPSISTPFMVMYFRNSARTFPKDTIEAARIDGLNEFQIFVKMFVPMMKPTYAAAATMTFMNAWNAYLWPKVVMQTNASQTMPMLVANITTGYVTDYGMLMAGVTLCSLPTVIVFFLLQKHFTNAVAGAVK